MQLIDVYHTVHLRMLANKSLVVLIDALQDVVTIIPTVDVVQDCAFASLLSMPMHSVLYAHAIRHCSNYWTILLVHQLVFYWNAIGKFSTTPCAQ